MGLIRCGVQHSDIQCTAQSKAGKWTSFCPEWSSEWYWNAETASTKSGWFC